MEIIRIAEEHWELMRAQRLEMLADTPLAYVETLETAQGLPESEWRFRALRCSGPSALGLAAVDESGRWLGTMSAFRTEEGTMFLVGVYVSPDSRGGGAADALLDAVEEWVLENAGSSDLVLEVHEDNARAQAFYRRRGYLPTGATTPYPLDPSQTEIVMARRLG